jgi:hypothetical protein
MAPFGVVATRMVFDVKGGGPVYTIDSTATLVDIGTHAQSALPDYS